ncbi:MAG: hypothetical protein AAGE94_04280 [Acidobacteriota bacterium]
MPTWRRAHALRNATSRDIGRFIRWDIDWKKGDFLEILARRVDDLALEQPPEGYRLALDCLLVVASRSQEADYAGQAYMAAGAAARRMGRSEEAAALYSRAESLVEARRSQGRLLLSKATLAMFDHRFDEADALVADSEAYLTHDQDDLALFHVVRGRVLVERYFVEALQSARQVFEIAFTSFSATVQSGSRKQIDAALDEYLAATELAANGSDLQAIALFNMFAFLKIVGGPDAVERRLSNLRELRRRMKKLRSRGSRRTWAYVDWLEGMLAYRRGIPREGRRLLIRAGKRFRKSGILFNALRVAVDLVEYENARDDALRLVAFSSDEYRDVRVFFEAGAPVDFLRQEVNRAAAGRY